MLPDALGQPQNCVGAGVALSAFNCDGNVLAPVVAALMLAALNPFLAAYSAPASTALLTCIASYIANPSSTVPVSRIRRNGRNSPNSMAAVPDSLQGRNRNRNFVRPRVIKSSRPTR